MQAQESFDEYMSILLNPQKQDLFKLLGEMDEADMESVLFFALGRRLGAEIARNKQQPAQKQ